MHEHTPRDRALPGWRGHFFYRAEGIRTTWKLRITVAAVLLLVAGTFRWWSVVVAHDLVCDQTLATSDAVLVENFDPDYLVFERAARLFRRGAVRRALVPIRADDESGTPNRISKGTAELMAQVSRLPSMELVPVRERELVTLNEARHLLSYMQRERITSLTAVVPAFRSRRSQLVYESIFGTAGIAVRCVPVFDTRTETNWTSTWHGVQEVILQFGKLQYYRYWVLPFSGGPSGGASAS